MGEYHVLWRFPNERSQRATYDSPSLPALVGMLARAEGVSTTTTEELFIHYHASDGQVLEVLGHDKRTGLMVVDYSKEPKVVPINSGKSVDKPKNKPHVRLVAAKPAAPKHPIQSGANGLYHASMATR